MGKFEELLGNVREATGPDRELDKSLALIAGWREITVNMPDINGSTVQVDMWFPDSADDPSISEWVAHAKAEVAANLWRDYDDYPRYTGSIDAALALLEIELPGWKWNVGMDARDEVHATVWHGVTEADEYAATPALAILAALLTALENPQ